MILDIGLEMSGADALLLHDYYREVRNRKVEPGV